MTAQDLEYRVRTRLANRARHETDSVRDIGRPPKIVDTDRREQGRHDLLFFLTTYFPQTFNLPWSPLHKEMVETTQRTIVEGGQYVVALPRGSGKTSIFQLSVIFSLVFGHRRFPMLICSDDTNFTRLLRGIKTQFETNQLLFDDFPELCHPIRSLDRTPNRAMHQTCEGTPTYIDWGQKRIQLPTTPWTVERGNAGGAISGGGLGGSGIRGQVISLPDGSQCRPDVVLLDDPQTRSSAKSPTQVQQREDVIHGDIAGMAGPGKRLAICCACTVIFEDDLASRLLDKERTPSFKSMRVPMIQSWPDAMEMWQKYHELRIREMTGDGEAGAAAAYYAANKEAMDRGGKVYWEERIQPGFSSALESAMFTYFTNPRSFMAEFQNSPQDDIDTDLPKIIPGEITRRQTAYRVLRCPSNAHLITAHVDVQKACLFATVVAWNPDFGGQVVWYGSYPEQVTKHFQLGSVTRTLEREYPQHDPDGALRQGIIDFLIYLNQLEALRDDGATIQLDFGLVDCRWKPEVVEQALIAAQLNNWMPAWGVGIGAKDNPLTLRTQWKGATGHYWVSQKPADRALRSIFIDTNYWKTEAHRALTLPITHTQSVGLFRVDHPADHQMWADHVSSERAVKVESKGRKIYEWELPGSKPDNHYWDTFVGSFVAASVRGLHKPEDQPRINHGQRGGFPEIRKIRW